MHYKSDILNGMYYVMGDKKKGMSLLLKENQYRLLLRLFSSNDSNSESDGFLKNSIINIETALRELRGKRDEQSI